jgi:hypothetical protein
MQAAESSSPETELQELCGLSPDESLVDAYPCKLQQNYACTHNSQTPAIQMAFAGSLSITDRHVCFVIEERGKKLPLKFAHVSVKKAAANGDGLTVALKDNTSMVFKGFADAEQASNALALVEHMSETR